MLVETVGKVVVVVEVVLDVVGKEVQINGGAVDRVVTIGARWVVDVVLFEFQNIQQ